MTRQEDIRTAIILNLVIDFATYITRGWLLTVTMVFIWTLVILHKRQMQRKARAKCIGLYKEGESYDWVRI